jgi:hypothetical protein
MTLRTIIWLVVLAVLIYAIVLSASFNGAH